VILKLKFATMRRAAWIFFASILLPSLGLAWMAVRSVQDQQVVLEHQQVVISQNITDALAQNIQQRMDQVRADFVQATTQLLGASPSPQILAGDFNTKLREAWPMAEIGFAVNLSGQIYSPKRDESPDAKTFRDENDRFLSNLENVEVYTSNSISVTQNAVSNQNSLLNQANAGQLTLNIQRTVNAMSEKTANEAQAMLDSSKTASSLDAQDKEVARGASLKGAMAGFASRIVSTETNAAPMAPAPTADAAAPMSSPVAAAAPAATDELMQSGSAAKAEYRAVPAAPDATTATATSTVAPTPSPPPPSAPGSAEGGAFPAPPLNAPASTANAPVSTAPASQDQADLNTASQTNLFYSRIQRQVIPQQMPTRNSAPLSNSVPAESDFRRAIGTETSGELARFLENKMRLLIWSHPAADAPIVFGAQIDREKLLEALRPSLQIPEIHQTNDSFSRTSDSRICAAILDDTGHPVALSRTGFVADWKHPFVATEIGEALPHWEAALYLVDPGQISRAARTLQLTLGLIVLLFVAAIVSGGSLIAADVRRQMRLAQQKTDFVSNVSHELKTPLTSIRMFADLLAEKRVPDEARQATYLRIIAAEASRLTRLINNVLDFARLERGVRVPPGEYRDCDLVDAVRDVAETCAPHLEAAGISFRSEIEAESLPIRGDRDALAQIILNLVSNAEKYGGQDVLVRVRRQETPAGALGCVDVLDRGAGIPAKQVRTVFEPFHRLDDSLSSGIPGSGLGLTLARRMARAHGGDVTYSPRAGGGSCFTLTVPLRGVS